MSAFFSRAPLGQSAALAPFALAGVAILATAFMQQRAVSHTVPSPAVETRVLRFSDAPQGAVRVEGADGSFIAAFASGEGAFVRGVLRTFARERRADAVAPEAPFELARHADGRVSLRDVSTGQTVVLDAFGATNAAAFASLLKSGEDTR